VVVLQELGFEGFHLSSFSHHKWWYSGDMNGISMEYDIDRINNGISMVNKPLVSSNMAGIYPLWVS